MIKSETVKECLSKLKQKFGAINVDFQQTIVYENTGSQVASFSRHDVIEDHQVSNLGVANQDFGLVEEPQPPPGLPPQPTQYGQAPQYQQQYQQQPYGGPPPGPPPPGGY